MSLSTGDWIALAGAVLAAAAVILTIWVLKSQLRTEALTKKQWISQPESIELTDDELCCLRWLEQGVIEDSFSQWIDSSTRRTGIRMGGGMVALENRWIIETLNQLIPKDLVDNKSGVYLLTKDGRAAIRHSSSREVTCREVKPRS